MDRKELQRRAGITEQGNGYADGERQAASPRITQDNVARLLWAIQQGLGVVGFYLKNNDPDTALEQLESAQATIEEYRQKAESGQL